MSLNSLSSSFSALSVTEASTACADLRGTKRFIEYAKLRGFIDDKGASAKELDANWKMHQFFGQIKLITMNPNSERCKKTKAELLAVGLKESDYVIVPGVDGATLDPKLYNRMVKWGCDKLTSTDCTKKLSGQTGCYLAHYNAIKDTAKRYQDAVKKYEEQRTKAAEQEVLKYSSVFIFEDNVGFGKVTGKLSADTTGYGTLFRKAMSELDDDWDMLYFMSMYGAEKTSEHLARLEYGLLMKCYALSAKVYDRVLKALSVIDEQDKEIKPVDHMLATLHKTENKDRVKAYVTLPPFCYRAASQSEVGGDLGKKSDERKHWQSNVDVSRSKEEEAALRKVLETHCTLPSRTCAISELCQKAVELRADDFKKAKELVHPVNDFTKKNHERKDKGKKAKSDRHIKGLDFDATDITGRQNFMFASCPQSYKKAGELLSVLVQRQGRVWVTTLESFEAKSKGNNFWKPENVSKVELTDGRKLEHVKEEEIGHGKAHGKGHDDSKIVQTTLKVVGAGQDVLLTHLHYFGWVDHNAAPDDLLLFALVMQMRKLNPHPENPFGINCHGGVGRTGTTGMCCELFCEIDAQRKEGKALDKIEVNILNTLFGMRMQGRDIVHQPAAFAQIYAVVGLYYNYLKAAEIIQDAKLLMSESNSVAKLVAEYSI